MAYTNRAFCWHGVITTDMDKARAFYSEALGFQIVAAPMGDGEVIMLTAGGVPRAHLRLPELPGTPSHWTHYLRIEDVDAGARAAVTHGGSMLVPPTDIPPGRFSVVTSPSGAQLYLFHEVDEQLAHDAPAGDCAIHWVELSSTQLNADLAWLRGALGFETTQMPMPMGEYTILNDGDQMRAGAMESMSPGAPSHWIAWVEVADVEQTLERVGRYGGAVLSPVMEAEGVGRMAVVQDSTGGSFGVITPASRLSR